MPAPCTAATTGPPVPNFARTNYTSNAGALGQATWTPPDGGNYCGPYYTDSKIKIAQVSSADGTSNTFGYGEILGGASTGARDFVASWMGAGEMASAWATTDPSAWYTFGSKHTAVVFFGNCDGSVRAVRKIGRDTDWYTTRWYAWVAATGYSDGKVFDSSQFGN